MKGFINESIIVPDDYCDPILFEDGTYKNKEEYLEDYFKMCEAFERFLQNPENIEELRRRQDEKASPSYRATSESIRLAA